MRVPIPPTNPTYGPGVNGFREEDDQRPRVDLNEARRLLTEAGDPEWLWRDAGLPE
jgi:glucan biosynthesis protein